MLVKTLNRIYNQTILRRASLAETGINPYYPGNDPLPAKIKEFIIQNNLPNQVFTALSFEAAYELFLQRFEKASKTILKDIEKKKISDIVTLSNSWASSKAALGDNFPETHPEYMLRRVGNYASLALREAFLKIALLIDMCQSPEFLERLQQDYLYCPHKAYVKDKQKATPLAEFKKESSERILAVVPDCVQEAVSGIEEYLIAMDHPSGLPCIRTCGIFSMPDCGRILFRGDIPELESVLDSKYNSPVTKQKILQSLGRVYLEIGIISSRYGIDLKTHKHSKFVTLPSYFTTTLESIFGYGQNLLTAILRDLGESDEITHPFFPKAGFNLQELTRGNWVLGKFRESALVNRGSDFTYSSRFVPVCAYVLNNLVNAAKEHQEKIELTAKK